jgi:hypothetical protein
VYEVFDVFLNRERWWAAHSGDDQVFLIQLGKVVWRDGFDPERMAEYFRKHMKLAKHDDSPVGRAINKRSQDACAVQKFLTYTQTLSMWAALAANH